MNPGGHTFHRWGNATRKRIGMGPGDIRCGVDTGTAGQQGYYSGHVGTEPCIRLLVQLARGAPDIGGAE